MQGEFLVHFLFNNFPVVIYLDKSAGIGVDILYTCELCNAQNSIGTVKDVDPEYVVLSLFNWRIHCESFKSGVLNGMYCALFTNGMK